MLLLLLADALPHELAMVHASCVFIVLSHHATGVLLPTSEKATLQRSNAETTRYAGPVSAAVNHVTDSVLWLKFC
jgi:hypothetical protein